MADSGASKTAARKALSEELKARDMKIRDWRHLDGRSQQEIMKSALTRKQPSAGKIRRADMKPVNEALYNSQKNYVERHGGIVLRGGEDVERHLDSVGADAAHLPGILFFRENPNTSEVLEEVFHYQQEERGDYLEYDDKIRELLRERDAQRYLLSVAKRYNIPEKETAQTENSLDEYLKMLKERGYDEGD